MTASALTLPELTRSEVSHRHGPSRAFVQLQEAVVTTRRPLCHSLSWRREGVGVQVAVPRGRGGRATVCLATIRVLGPVADLSFGVEVQATRTAHGVLLVADTDVEHCGVDGVADIDSFHTSTTVGYHSACGQLDQQSEQQRQKHRVHAERALQAFVPFIPLARSYSFGGRSS